MTSNTSSEPAKTVRNRAMALPRVTRILCVLFFFSGFPALLYQLVWQRALFEIFGVNIECITIVVTAFMIGLGFGSLIGGVLSRLTKIPLLPMLATIEILIGIYGMFSLGLFEKVGDLVLMEPLQITAAVSLALVIVPTLLMGATLPILVGYLVRRSNNVGNSLGLLYYNNTLGAGAVCLLATLFLFPFFSMHTIVLIAVAMNFAVATGALIIYRRDGKFETAPTTAKKAASKLLIKFPYALFLGFLGGFVSLSYEIFIFHVVSFATGSSAWAFALTLGAFLIGLASGSRCAAAYCKQSGKQKIMDSLLTSLIWANVFGFMFLPALNVLGFIGRALIGVALLLTYLLARHWGTLLPCLAHFGIKADVKAGFRTSLLYLFNILGSASGSILTGFVLMNYLGLAGLSAFLIIMGTLCVMLLIAALPMPRKTKVKYWFRMFVAAAVVATLMPFLTIHIFERLMTPYKDVIKPPFSDVVENRNGIIAVDQSGTVFGNGVYDGQFNIDPMNDSNGIIRPYALNLFHPMPTKVLMIGLASGSWAQVIANNPDVEELTIVEINPGYADIIAHRMVVSSLLKNPKVKIITDDGRRWLRRNPGEKFDVIVSNTTFYFRNYASYLLSSDFLQLIKQHLNKGGVYFYNTTDSARAQRTGCESFPYGARFTNHLLLSMTPIDWDFDRWRDNLQAYMIDGDLMFDLSQPEVKQAFGRGSLELYLKDKIVEPCPDIIARTNGMEPITDDNMGSEWRNIYGEE